MFPSPLPVANSANAVADFEAADEAFDDFSPRCDVCTGLDDLVYLSGVLVLLAPLECCLLNDLPDKCNEDGQPFSISININMVLQSNTFSFKTHKL